MTVQMEKECGCFKRSSFEAVKDFENKDEAMLYAMELCNNMNETFCQKHRFSIVENDDILTITMAMNG